MKKEEGKILGIIGGMGPLATNVFYKMVIDQTPAHRDQDHINTLIVSHATMPDRTHAIQSGDLSQLIARLQEDAVFLQNSGADCIAIPCNTSHVVFDQIQEAVDIPIVNMVRETIGVLETTYGCGNQKVGILATDGTIEVGIYQKEMRNHDMIPVIPTPETQKKVMQIIYDMIKAGNPVDAQVFLQVENQLRSQGCQRIVLACTELSCYRQDAGLSDYFIDAMEILAGKVVTLCK